MNLLLCLLLATQKPKTSQPIPTGWEVSIILGAIVGLAIAKFGVEKPQGLQEKNIKSNLVNQPDSYIPTVLEPAHVEYATAQSHDSDIRLAPNAQSITTNVSPHTETGQRIIDELVHTKLSTLLAAPSGAGKSVTQSYWLTKLFENYPSADVYVIARKNDSFNGLSEKGKVWVYDSSDPATALEALQKVYEIFLDRSQLPEGIERDKLKSLPVRLIIADWYSTHNSLTKSHKKLWESQVQTKLADIVTVAREFNVSLFVDSQTYNIASLGLAEDSNIRNNLNIISQGLISLDEDGNEQGGFEVIQSIVRNPYIFPDGAMREKFVIDVAKYIKLSTQNKVPIIISTSGKPKAGLLPNLLEYKGKKIRESENKVPQIAPNKVLTTATLTPIPTICELTAADALPEPLRTIWKATKEAKGEWLAVRDISRKDYAVLKGKNTAAEITSFVEQLAAMELIEINRTHAAIRFKT
jgi:hypothetical protein